MTDLYEPPAWRWDIEPEEMAAIVYARRNPLDEIWLARLRIELGKEDHQHRCVTRDVDALDEVRKRTHFLGLVNQEVQLLETKDIALERVRRQREEDEMREINARELERKRAEEAAALERKRIADSIEARRAARQDQIAELVARDLEDAIAHRGEASVADAVSTRAAAYGINALIEIEELEARIARLEDKRV